MYTQCGADYESVRNLVKATSLQISKVRDFLHSEPSYTKITLTIRKFKAVKVFARLKCELWCIDIAYVDKRAQDTYSESIY